MEKTRTLLGISSILLTLLASSSACHQSDGSSPREDGSVGSLERPPVDDQLELSECRLPVESIYRDDAFVTVTSFRVGADGSPEQLKILSNHAKIPETEFHRCISKWRFHSIPEGVKVFAAFRWEGAVGWRHIRLSAESEGFSKEISFEAEP